MPGSATRMDEAVERMKGSSSEELAAVHNPEEMAPPDLET
jgi:hypothetical protein